MNIKFIHHSGKKLRTRTNTPIMLLSDLKALAVKMFGADVVEDHFSYVDSEGDKIEICNQDDWENSLEDY